MLANQFPKVVQRSRGVVIESTEAIDVIKRWDSPDTLHYIDPPYVAATRTAPKAYVRHEMPNEQHEHLLSVVTSAAGYVAVSGYRCDMYDRALADWRRIEIDRPNDSGQGKTKQRRTEAFWLSW